MPSPHRNTRVASVAVVIGALALVLPVTASAVQWQLTTRPISGPVALAPGCADDADENTPQIAVDPTDPSDLAATYAVGDGSASVLARSDDAGASWTRSAIAGTVSCDGGGGSYGYRFDPDLGFDPSGRLYLTESVQSAQDRSGTSGIDDLLLTAAPGSDELSGPLPVLGAAPVFGAQRGFLAFPSTRPGGVDVLTEQIGYVAGQYEPVSGSLDLASSSDGGNALTVNRIYTAPPDESVVAEGLVQYGQTLLAFGEEINVSQLPSALGLGASAQEQAVVARSDDGGVKWSAPRVVFTHEVGADGVSDCCLLRPVAAPDGTIYWPDASGGLLSLYRSTDAGTTWSRQVLPDVTNASEPTVAAGAGGRVMVAFYTLGTDAKTVTPRIEVSDDRGSTWQPLSFGSATSLASLGPVDDTSELGPVQGAAATPAGFVAAMTVGGPLVSAGGGSDVDLITVTRPMRAAVRHTRPARPKQDARPPRHTRPARPSAGSAH